MEFINASLNASSGNSNTLSRPIVVTVSRQLSWSHYKVLIAIEKKEERQFYEV
ncbi:MAG: hypothetical protein KAS90_04260 [Candidatus Aenigmarchaeota archaeon]|nr:hypothetical protein [Candidatus Aenigmarchaeota archaeon]